jgi:hypothetical protein
MHSICLFGAKSPTHLILLGGVAISGTAFSDIWALDLNTLEWILVPTGSKTFPPRPQSSDVVINGELFVFGGIDMQAAINKTGLPAATSDVFKFPLHEAMCKLLQPTENSWKCISCLEFTSRKCSHGCNTPICSESCEDMALNFHEEECVKKGGREDPIKKKMREMENHITNLKARIESEDLKRKQLLQETEALITKTKRDEHMIRRFQEQMDELSTITINLKETIDEKSKKLAENEIQAKNEASKNQTLSLEVKTLLEQLELSHKLQEKRQNVIEELSNNIKTTSDKIAEEKLQKQRLAKQFEEIIQIIDTVEQQLEERKLELESLQRRQEEAKEKELCGVCFENIKDHVLPCGHLFCLPCIQHLHKRNPLCRVEFDKPRKVFI